MHTFTTFTVKREEGGTMSVERRR